LSELAEIRYAKVFESLTGQWEATRTFREIARIGLPIAEAQIAKANASAADQFLTSDELDHLFLNKEAFLKHVGGPTELAKKMTTGQVSSFRSTIDAASLVFLHSAVDAAVSDLCDIAAMVAPSDWELWLAEKKIPFSRLKNEGYIDLRDSELRSVLERLKRESLMKRVDRLFALCRPEPNLKLVGEYTFDRHRLEALDNKRHAIIHGDGTFAATSSVEESLEFLFRTGLYLFAMLNRKYDVKMNIFSLNSSTTP
jgi:hypothetical protein